MNTSYKGTAAQGRFAASLAAQIGNPHRVEALFEEAARNNLGSRRSIDDDTIIRATRDLTKSVASEFISLLIAERDGQPTSAAADLTEHPTSADFAALDC